MSRRFKAVTQNRLDARLTQHLSTLSLSTTMVDGLHVEEHVILIALGIDDGGKKHVLGLWEGATENHKVCMSLLTNLVGRGLDAQRSMLFAIDGSKALRKAIRPVFGEYAVVQRCQVHKTANVRDHLPKEMHKSVGKSMRDAYKAPPASAAKRRLLAVAGPARDRPPGSGCVAA